MAVTADSRSPRCIASTPCVDEDSSLDQTEDRQSTKNNFYKEAQWSSDGTCLITNSADNTINTFVVPADLLDENNQPHLLTAYSAVPSPEPVKSYACYPGYDLVDASTTLVLSSQRDHPIRLNNVLDGSKVASYPLINPMTDAYISPHSLHFTRGGSHFVAGCDNLISVFDASRIGEGPISYLPTNHGKDGGVMGMKGIVAAIDVDETSEVLAAGTFSRQIGLYDDSGQGECVGVFSVDGTDADGQIGGVGITQVKWSADGRYLYICERKSDGVMFYDIRKTGQLLGWLTGRNARTNQRLGVNIDCADGITRVWAGGTDGFVRQWLNPHEKEGAVETILVWRGHNDVVSSAISHPSGSILASCSGHRHEDDSALDCSLKIWSN